MLQKRALWTLNEPLAMGRVVRDAEMGTDRTRGCFHKSYMFVVCCTLVTCVSLHVYVTRMDAFYRYRLQFFDKWTCRAGRNMVERTQTDKSSCERVARTILVWNPFFGLAYYGLEVGDTGFRKYQCPEPRCYLTTDRSQLSTVDAVLFHGFLLGGTPIPPRTRREQIYVFLLMESPLLANRYDWLSGLQDTFNMTMTYLDSPDTDIVMHSGSTIPSPGPDANGIPSLKDISRKSKMAFWIVSNCQPLSTRDEYVQQLSRYIEVDTFGKCGQPTCKKGDWSCFKSFSEKYFFNLAFENSYCDSYISEKAFRALQQPVVPITLGGSNYSELLPPGSYIDVQDYTSPKHLAQYLLHLTKNPLQYQEYFSWKRSQQAMDSQYTRAQGFCTLCQILHNSSYSYKTGFDPRTYWDPQLYCLSGDEERAKVHLGPETS